MTNMEINEGLRLEPQNFSFGIIKAFINIKHGQGHTCSVKQQQQQQQQWLHHTKHDKQSRSFQFNSDALQKLSEALFPVFPDFVRTYLPDKCLLNVSHYSSTTQM